MIINQGGLQSFTFTPVLKNRNNKSIRICAIEGITGLRNIDDAFLNPLNNTEVELLVSFLERKYKLHEVEDDIYFYIRDVIGFSDISLENINANYEEYYDNMSISEALTVILTKLIDHKGESPVNGFPREFHFSPNNRGIIQNYKNRQWFPVSDNRQNINYENLLIRVMRSFNTDNSKIMFHGTSWRSAISIMNRIRINQRLTSTDFGLRNFYLTDNFQTSCMWALRNNYAAIVIFIIPEEFIDNLQHHLILNEKILWQQTVFRIRNPPEEGDNLDELIDEYESFIREIDSNDLISGPIVRNIKARTIEDVDYIKYGELVPYQYSFKDSTVNFLNNMIAVTLFFEDV